MSQDRGMSGSPPGTLRGQKPPTAQRSYQERDESWCADSETGPVALGDAVLLDLLDRAAPESSTVGLTLAVFLPATTPRSVREALHDRIADLVETETGAQLVWQPGNPLDLHPRQEQLHRRAPGSQPAGGEPIHRRLGPGGGRAASSSADGDRSVSGPRDPGAVDQDGRGPVLGDGGESRRKDPSVHRRTW
jgi:hypothetical protein